MTVAAPDREQPMRAAFQSGQLEEAASAALRAYSGEILSFLTARLRSQSDAQEAFSMFAEDLWLGLPGFAWRCSMRTWAYTLARNAATRYSSAPHRRPANNIRLSYPGVVSQLVEEVRRTTLAYQRTDGKDRFQALREQLDPDDYMLLVLRVDRGVAWRDLAIMLSGDADLDDASITREAARLRKAFERVKTELKRLAKREGLL
jgi:RNA polymerase sigma-70 factor, ECF subfamily